MNYKTKHWLMALPLVLFAFFCGIVFSTWLTNESSAHAALADEQAIEWTNSKSPNGINVNSYVQDFKTNRVVGHKNGGSVNNCSYASTAGVDTGALTTLTKKVLGITTSSWNQAQNAGNRNIGKG